MANVIAPRLVVTLDDDREFTIQTDNRDMVRFDLLRSRKKWPAFQDAPFLAMTVLAWSCLRREGVMSDNVEAEIDKIVSVEAVDENGNPVDTSDPDAMSVDPTKQEASSI